jgi:hypothetical protein
MPFGRAAKKVIVGALRRCLKNWNKLMSLQKFSVRYKNIDTDFVRIERVYAKSEDEAWKIIKEENGNIVRLVDVITCKH